MAKTKKDETPEDNVLEPELETDAETSPETPSEPVSPVEELELALRAEKDKFLRLAAEFDNYKKRSAKEREALYCDIKSETVAKLLPVYDNLVRALKMECSDNAFYKGVDMTMTQLKDILAKLGISEIPAVGEPFDPDLHNAVLHVEDPSLGESTVAEEFEKGFRLGDKVIRCSMVKVAN